MKCFNVSLLVFQYLLNLQQSCSICLLDSIGQLLHGHVKSMLGKNCNLYSPIGAWLVIALVVRAQSKFKQPKAWSQGPPLAQDGSITLRSSSKRSRKWLPFPSNAWKVIFHSLFNSLQSNFLQKSQDNLVGYEGVTEKDFASLSMSW